MTVYLGRLGRMIELWSTPSSQVEAEDPYSFQVTVEGNRRAQRKATGRRTWSVSAEYSTPADVGVLSDFATGAWGPGPWVFIPADAPNANLLTPQAASCDPSAGWRVSNSAGGPLLTPDGWAPRSVQNNDITEVLWFGDEYVPVLPGRPVTVSAYVRGAGAAVRIYWYDEAGANVTSSTSTVTATAGSVVRSWVTATPPAGAVSLRVRAVNAAVGTRPSVTWGDVLHPWADGRGCLKAVVHAASSDSFLAGEGAGRQFSSLSYTVTEVG